MLAARETTDAVKPTADALEPAGADMMIQELATDAMHAGLLGGEVTALVIRLRLQAQHVMHRSSIALLMYDTCSELQTCVMQPSNRA